MPKLYTYTIPWDDGAAPNPFNGMCSLAICKPGIRKAAKPDDWVAGFGSKNAPSGDLSGHLVYAMKINEVLTLREYDRRAPQDWPHRIPNVQSLAMQERLGDCIYHYPNGILDQRASVHNAGNMVTDVRGENVLLSWNYYYFGSSAIKIPEYLHPVLHQTQGFKSNCNAPYFDRFVDWLTTSTAGLGQIYGWPDAIAKWEGTAPCGGCNVRQTAALIDRECS